MMKKTDLEEKERILHEAESFAQELAEYLANENVSELEPFEQYTHYLKSKVMKGTGEFAARFAKGYRILLDELTQRQPNSARKSESTHG